MGWQEGWPPPWVGLAAGQQCPQQVVESECEEWGHACHHVKEVESGAECRETLDHIDEEEACGHSHGAPPSPQPSLGPPLSCRLPGSARGKHVACLATHLGRTTSWGLMIWEEGIKGYNPSQSDQKS